MSQHDFNIANQTFPSFRADLNDALVAAATMSAGSSAPTTPYAYQLWFDTTTGTWKVRNSGNTAWVSTITTDLATGNVGVGTASPAHLIDGINTAGSATARFGSTYNIGANNGTVIIGNGGSGKAMLRFDYEGTNTDRARIGVSSSAQQLEFYTAGDNKRATLDSTGNLLVGKTSTGISAAGHSYRSDGTWEVRRDIGTANSSSVGYLSRGTTDGNILTFYKDTTTVGSISSRSGIALTINSQSGNGNLAYGGTNYVEWNNTRLGVATDNTIDLGRSAGRFKDLYLSGGVYLGGTAAANKLDDYEEGTWSPSINASTTDPTVTYTTRLGAYVIIGNTVYISFYIYCSAGNVTGGVGNIQIGNLPVAIQPNGGYSSFGLPLIPAGYIHTGGATQNAENNNTMRWQANANPSTKINLYSTNSSSHGTGAWELSGSGTFPIA